MKIVLTINNLISKCKEYYKTLKKAKDIKRSWSELEDDSFNRLKESDLVKNLSTNSVCIDCGANVGRISELFAKSGARVYSFEPNPLCLNVLKRRVKKYPNVEVIEKGVLDKCCTMKLYHSDLTNADSEFFSQSSSICATKDNVNTENFIEIECIDLCSFIKDLIDKLEISSIDILKMDVEGAEFAILEKMIEDGLYKKIKYILVETHDETIPEIQEKAKRVRELIISNDIKNINLDWV